MRPRDIGGCSSTAGSSTGQTEYLLPRPADGVLDLLVTWPLAGLAEVRVRVPLEF
jgi:hypothetical protein